MTEPGATLLERMSDELAALVERVLGGIVSLAGDEGGRRSSGSGFVIDDAGHVVTNHHVVEGYSTTMQAVVAGGAPRPARILGRDGHTDLAVLRLPEPAGRPLRLRERPARLGELCLGVGTPYGVYPDSVSFGVVSGLARDIPQEGHRPLEDAIQTDVAINPGNSGGPLVDVAGGVLGVNVRIDSRGNGIGFAIPAATVRYVAGELVAEGRVRRAALGVGVVNETVEDEGRPRPRLVVTKVASGPAEGALRAGDVIVALDGEAVRERADLYRLLTKERIGRAVTLSLRRDGADHAVQVEPAELVERE